MRVVVAGGSGLIGRALVAALADAGQEAVVLSRRPQAVDDPRSRVRTVAWDPIAPASYVAALEGADAVVNLAGASIADGRWTVARKRELTASRVVVGAALADALTRCRRPPPVLVQGSAVGYYGDRGDLPLDERAPPGDDFLGRLCVAWEASTDAVEELGVRRVLLRTGVVLAREGGALPRMALPFRAGVGGRLGDGAQWFPWIHVADTVAAIRFLLAAEAAHGAVNLVAPEPVRNRELTRLLGRLLRRPTLLPVPAVALRLALGEMATMLLASQRVVPSRLEELGFRFTHATAADALADLLDG